MGAGRVIETAKGLIIWVMGGESLWSAGRIMRKNIRVINKH